MLWTVLFDLLPIDFFSSLDRKGLQKVSEGSLTEIVLTGLNPDTIYYIAVTQFNELGGSEPSPEIEARTLPEGRNLI